MNSAAHSEPYGDSIRFGEWQAWRASGELVSATRRVRLEPKVMELLWLLASRPNEVVAKEEILERLWPRLVIGEDTLARAISKLRRALDDDPKAPRVIETLPKRGYRLIARVALASPTAESASPSPPRPSFGAKRRWLWASAAALLLALGAIAWFGRVPSPDAASETQAVVERAHDFYFQYSRADNAAAIELYERVLAVHPDHAPAQAGLANALVQSMMRWPETDGADPQEFTRLGDALAHGHLRTPRAERMLQRAEQLAQRAVELAPNDASAHKALGFVHSARERFDLAIEHYRRAVALDPDSWGPLINIGDVLEIAGREQEALPYFESAYDAMTRVYATQATRIQPWYADLGVLIGDRHLAQDRITDAQTWYRRVLEYAPLHPAATARLAASLRETGEVHEAERLCAALSDRVGAAEACAVNASSSP